MTNERNHPSSRNNFLWGILIVVPILAIVFFILGYAILFAVGEAVEHFTP